MTALVSLTYLSKVGHTVKTWQDTKEPWKTLRTTGSKNKTKQSKTKKNPDTICFSCEWSIISSVFF